MDMSSSKGTGEAMKQTGPAIPQSPDTAKGLQLEQIKDAQQLAKYEALIVNAMEYDALDSSQDKNMVGRQHEVDRMPHHYLREGMHGGLHLIKDGDEPVGFVALRTNSTKRVGTVERIWLAGKHHQEHVFTKTLDTIEDHFRRHNCDRGIIMATELRPEFERVVGRTDVERFFSVEMKGEDEDTIGIPHPTIQ